MPAAETQEATGILPVGEPQSELRGCEGDTKGVCDCFLIEWLIELREESGDDDRRKLWRRLCKGKTMVISGSRTTCIDSQSVSLRYCTAIIPEKTRAERS